MRYNLLALFIFKHLSILTKLIVIYFQTVKYFNNHKITKHVVCILFAKGKARVQEYLKRHKYVAYLFLKKLT